MMGAADDVASVQITADVSDYVEGMKQAAGATTQAMDGIKASTQAAAGVARDSLGRFSKGAQEAADAAKETGVAADELAGKLPPLTQAAERGGNAFEGLGGQILKAGRTARSEGRFASFIARDIEALIPISSQAGGAIAGLISGLAYGSGIAVAVSLVRLLVAAFKDTNTGIKQLSNDSAAALDKMKAQVADIVASLRGETQGQNIGRMVLKAAEDARDAQKLVVDGRQRELDIANAIFQKNVEIGAAQAGGNAHSAQQKNLNDEKARLDLLTKQLVNLREQQGIVVKEEGTRGDSETAAKLNAQRLESERQLQIQLQEINTQGLQGNEKIESEYVARDEQIKQAGLERIKQILDEARGKDAQAQAAADAAVAQAREATEAKVNANLQAYRRELTNFNTEELKKQATIESEFRLKQLEAAIAAQKAMDALNATNDKNLLERQKRLEKFDKDNAKSYVKDFIGPVTSASSGFIKGILLQQENVLDAIKGLAVSMAGAVIDGLAKMAEKAIIAYATETAASKVAAVSTTQGNIAMAATGAASAVASIPFAGPALAAAAFAETTALLEAGTAPMLSARGGMGSVPFDDMPFLLHKREMVMPEPLASGARNLFSAFSNGTPAPSGGNGGGDSGPPIHVHLHEHYGPGVIVDQHSMDKHYSSPEFQTSIDRAIRTGKARFK